MDILISLLFLLIYIIFCRDTGSYINSLTPYFILTFSTKFFLDIIYNYIYDINREYFITFIIYSSYVCELFFLVIGYNLAKNNTVSIKLFNIHLNKEFYLWIILGISYFIYSPVIIEYYDYIVDPREIYIRTRTGYGLYYFLSIATANLSFICFLFTKEKNKIKSIIYLILYTFNLYLHGSKGVLITPIFIYILYLVCLKSIKFNLINSFKFLIIIFSSAIILFSITLPETMRDNLLIGILNYSDYNRNMEKLIVDPIPPTYGKLTIENNILSLIPRIIYPEKPKNFGSFYLSEIYYPEWFYMDSGSPAFGNGTYFSDFGYYFFLYLAIVSFIFGYLLRLFFNSTKKFKTIFYFIIYLALAWSPIIDTAVGSPLIPNLLVTLLLAILVFFVKLR